MSETAYRYWNVEHISMMILAIVLITVGYSKSKKAKDDKSKHKTIALFYSIALIIVLAAIFTMKDRNPWWNM